MEVAGDIGSNGRSNFRDGGDELALFGIEGNIFEEGIRVCDVFGNFSQRGIWQEREEALKSLRPEAGMGRDGGKRQDEGAPMVWKGIEGAGKGLSV